MDQSHEEHLERILHDNAEDTAIKYRVGDADHGGRLWVKSGIVKNIRQEATDLSVYTHVLGEQLKHVENLLLAGQPDEALKWVTAMLSDEMEEVVDN